MLYLVTGAAQGLGRALAVELATRRQQIVLSDRNQAGLLETVKLCRELGVEAHAVVADVTAGNQLYDAVQALPEAFRLPDVIIANAGLGGINPGYAFSREIDDRTMAVNYTGMINTLMPFVPAMLARGRGALCGICSIAGLRGLPNASSYCASKAAQAAFLESMRLDLVPAGISVTCVHPGFIATPMNEHNEFPMPFMVRTERAAQIVLRAIERGESQTYFPTLLGLLGRFNRLLPNGLSDILARRLAGARDKRPQIFLGAKRD